jgi:hypothetical protein
MNTLSMHRSLPSVLTGFFALEVAYVRRAEIHKRLMYLVMIAGGARTAAVVRCGTSGLEVYVYRGLTLWPTNCGGMTPCFTGPS